MCMIVDDKVTKKVKARLKRGKGVAKFWKIYRRCPKSLAGVYGHAGIRTSGRHQSTRRNTKVARGEQHVMKGFHVCLSKGAAQRLVWYATEVVVPVYCRSEELVAGGTFGNDDNAVFTHIEIKPEDFAKAIGK